ncbi:MAG: redoxin domain-containing protein [Deltaproteobacteria bacterium]|nr:MAG: redoxin domain-containing protein [Deltaproteobacteria bacterium]
MRKIKILSWMCLFIIGSHLSFAFALRHLKTGDSVPNFAIRTIDGNHISLDERKKKITVLVFWKQNDDKSCNMLTDLSRINEEFQGKGVTFLAINGDRASDRQIRELALSKKLTCLFAGDPDLTTYSRLGIVVLPTTLIIGPDGKLAFIQDLYSRNFFTQTIAYIRFLLGEITQAQLDAELDPGRSVKVSPARIKADRYVNLGRLLLDIKEKEKAREALEKAVEADPTFPEPHLLLAGICLEDKEVRKAGTELEQALKLNPCPKEGRLLQGLTYAGQGEDALAIAVLQELVENNPEPPPEAYYEIGKIYEKQKKTSEALAAYGMALKLLLAQ